MELLDFTIDVIKDAGVILRKRFYENVQEYEKGFADIVTEADKEAENYIIRRIKDTYPNHKILSEEIGEIGEGEYLWVIDPLDGTTNFRHHIPYFAISIALKYRQDTILGVVYNPILDEMYYAKDKAYMNGNLIRPSEDVDLSKAFLGICHGNDKQSIDRFIATTGYYKYRVREIRRLGCASLEIVYVASGRLAAFFGYDLKPWDYEAALHIARKAGCYVETDKNNILVYGSEQIRKKLNFNP